ncbi:NAD-P-binding protein [Leucosporidium creatinivorum]|uniref:NAD-P-binding protein n=1 Tax=Leucosporidium creatinivorum TaxID=106004 RepID=A0A1Y2FYX8_9BASI|nr:NAD-P-binding protein [Leucosporidium creatinivorum]
MAPRVILITGSSTGFGRALVDAALARGDIAIATLRKPSVLDDLKLQYGPERLLVLPLDVTENDDIGNAFKQARLVYGRVDAVISNAGFSVFAEAEAVPEEVTRSMFETNVFGSIALARRSVAFFRDENPTPGGHFIVISSVAGVMPNAAMGVYAATKAAIEAYASSLAQEVASWSIKVTTVTPSLFKTPGIAHAPKLPVHPAYVEKALPSNFIRHYFSAESNPEQQWGDDPAKAALAILGLLDKETAPLRFPLGAEAIGGFKAKAEQLRQEADEHEAIATSMVWDDEA